MTTILLVDGDPLRAFSSMAHLKRAFKEVWRAADAAEALCLVEQLDFAENVGLIISGHHTRGLDGPSFVAEVRSRLPWVPVLVLGATAEEISDYPRENVYFLPARCLADQIISLSRSLMAQPASNVA